MMQTKQLVTQLNFAFAFILEFIYLSSRKKKSTFVQSSPFVKLTRKESLQRLQKQIFYDCGDKIPSGYT